MKRQHMEHLLLVGADEDEESWSGASAPKVVPGGEGRNEEASGPGQPGREAAAAAEGEGAGELSGEGPSAADAAGLEDDGDQEGASGGGQENEQRPQEPVHEGVGDNQGVPPPVPAPEPAQAQVQAQAARGNHTSSIRFSRWQLHVLESVFQRTHYITADVRKQLAEAMGVSEAKVQNWFKRKREQYRKYQNL